MVLSNKLSNKILINYSHLELFRTLMSSQCLHTHTLYITFSMSVFQLNQTSSLQGMI